MGNTIESQIKRIEEKNDQEKAEKRKTVKNF